VTCACSHCMPTTLPTQRQNGGSLPCLHPSNRESAGPNGRKPEPPAEPLRHPSNDKRMRGRFGPPPSGRRAGFRGRRRVFDFMKTNRRPRCPSDRSGRLTCLRPSEARQAISLQTLREFGRRRAGSRQRMRCGGWPPLCPCNGPHGRLQPGRLLKVLSLSCTRRRRRSSFDRKGPAGWLCPTHQQGVEISEEDRAAPAPFVTKAALADRLAVNTQPGPMTQLEKP